MYQQNVRIARECTVHHNQDSAHEPTRVSKSQWLREHPDTEQNSNRVEQLVTEMRSQTEFNAHLSQLTV